MTPGGGTLAGTTAATAPTAGAGVAVSPTAPGVEVVPVAGRRPVAAGDGGRPTGRPKESNRELGCDPILQVEQLVKRSIDLRGAEDRPALDLEQSSGNAQLVARTLIAAGHHPASAEPAAGGQRRFRRIVRHAVRGRGRLLADDRHHGPRVKVGHDRLGDPDPDPVVSRLPRDVGEPKDRHDVRRLGGTPVGRLLRSGHGLAGGDRRNKHPRRQHP